MYRKALLLVLILVAVAGAYAAGAGSKLDEPIPFTARVLAEIICAAKSDDVVTFSYQPEGDTVLAVTNPVLASGKYATDTRQRIVPKRAAPVMAFMQKHVSPAARLEIR